MIVSITAMFNPLNMMANLHTSTWQALKINRTTFFSFFNPSKTLDLFNLFINFQIITFYKIHVVNFQLLPSTFLTIPPLIELILKRLLCKLDNFTVKTSLD